MAEKKNIQIELIETNKGQIEGVPANPRVIKDKKFKKLVKSIEKNPEMLDLREILVYPLGDKFIAIGGNMRLEAVKKLGYKEVPCKVLPVETPAENLRAYILRDNASYGEWDFDELANCWDIEELELADIDVPEIKATELLSGISVDESIYYEPKEIQQSLYDCVNLEVFNKKISAIEEYDLSEEQKEVLRLFAYRFIKIDFEAVANYYATKATEEEKKAIERLRLVLVDNALNGFIEDDLLKIANLEL